jgi:hypothetical protein
MFSSAIYEDDINIIYETRQPVHFSILTEGAFHKTWGPWKPRFFALREDATLVFRKTKESPIIAKLDMTGTKISKMGIDASTNPLLFKEYGISVTCIDRGVETSFRCILHEVDLQAFVNAIKAFVPSHEIAPDAVPLDSYKSSRGDPTPGLLFQDQSVMRRSLASAMDLYSRRTKYDQIIDRRGRSHTLTLPK